MREKRVGTSIKARGLIAGAKFWAPNGGRSSGAVAELLYFAPSYNISVTHGQRIVPRAFAHHQQCFWPALTFYERLVKHLAGAYFWPAANRKLPGTQPYAAGLQRLPGFWLIHPNLSAAASAGCTFPNQAGMNIRSMEARHWPQVRAIYEAGIATGNATFATQVARGQGWNKAHLPHSRLVALHPSGRVLGWAALAPAPDQGHAPGVADIQVYVAAAAQGQGVGRALLAALVAASETHGIWTLHAVVFPENQAMPRLCQAAGFRVVGRYARIGQLHGIWRDVLVLERRSAVVGTADASLLPASHSARNTMGSVTLTHTG